MKLFVTGATGFVGSHFVALALREGHQVVAIHRAPGEPPLTAGGLTWRRQNLDTVTANDFDECQALVHFAAVGVSPKRATTAELLHWNVVVQQRLLETAHEAGVRRFVICGSSAEYGLSADRHEFIPATAPLLPTTGYASSKAAGFACCHATAIELSLELCYLRLFGAYGEGQHRENFFPALREAALSGRDFEMTMGEQVRDYVRVEAAAVAFLHAATRPDGTPGRPLVANVGSGRPVAMRDFAREWWSSWQAAGALRIGVLPYRAHETMRSVPELRDGSEPWP